MDLLRLCVELHRQDDGMARLVCENDIPGGEGPAHARVSRVEQPAAEDFPGHFLEGHLLPRKGRLFADKKVVRAKDLGNDCS
jgi:hypothetical protein